MSSSSSSSSSVSSKSKPLPTYVSRVLSSKPEFNSPEDSIIDTSGNTIYTASGFKINFNTRKVIQIVEPHLKGIVEPQEFMLDFTLGKDFLVTEAQINSNSIDYAIVIEDDEVESQPIQKSRLHQELLKFSRVYELEQMELEDEIIIMDEELEPEPITIIEKKVEPVVIIEKVEPIIQPIITIEKVEPIIQPIITIQKKDSEKKPESIIIKKKQPIIIEILDDESDVEPQKNVEPQRKPLATSRVSIKLKKNARIVYNRHLDKLREIYRLIDIHEKLVEKRVFRDSGSVKCNYCVRKACTCDEFMVRDKLEVKIQLNFKNINSIFKPFEPEYGIKREYFALRRKERRIFWAAALKESNEQQQKLSEKKSTQKISSEKKTLQKKRKTIRKTSTKNIARRIQKNCNINLTESRYEDGEQIVYQLVEPSVAQEVEMESFILLNKPTPVHEFENSMNESNLIRKSQIVHQSPLVEPQSAQVTFPKEMYIQTPKDNSFEIQLLKQPLKQQEILMKAKLMSSSVSQKTEFLFEKNYSPERPNKHSFTPQHQESTPEPERVEFSSDSETPEEKGKETKKVETLWVGDTTKFIGDQTQKRSELTWVGKQLKEINKKEITIEEGGPQHEESYPSLDLSPSEKTEKQKNDKFEVIVEAPVTLEKSDDLKMKEKTLKKKTIKKPKIQKLQEPESCLKKEPIIIDLEESSELPLQIQAIFSNPMQSQKTKFEYIEKITASFKQPLSPEEFNTDTKTGKLQIIGSSTISEDEKTKYFKQLREISKKQILERKRKFEEKNRK